MTDTPGDPPFVVVGHVSKPHGTKGELFVWPLTDYPEHTFVPGVRLLVADAWGNLPDPEWPPVVLEGVRPFKRGFLLVVEGVRDRNAADPFHGRYLLRPLEEVQPLDRDEIFHHQLRGLTVVTDQGETVGPVVEVYEARPVDLLEVRREEGGTVLIPFHRDVVAGWDLETRVLRITPPDGLLDV
jgi:16S rRNA processing protein RimM